MSAECTPGDPESVDFTLPVQHMAGQPTFVPCMHAAWMTVALQVLHHGIVTYLCT